MYNNLNQKLKTLKNKKKSDDIGFEWFFKSDEEKEEIRKKKFRVYAANLISTIEKHITDLKTTDNKDYINKYIKEIDDISNSIKNKHFDKDAVKSIMPDKLYKRDKIPPMAFKVDTLKEFITLSNKFAIVRNNILSEFISDDFYDITVLMDLCEEKFHNNSAYYLEEYEGTGIRPKADFDYYDLPYIKDTSLGNLGYDDKFVMFVINQKSFLNKQIQDYKSFRDKFVVLFNKLLNSAKTVTKDEDEKRLKELAYEESVIDGVIETFFRESFRYSVTCYIEDGINISKKLLQCYK